MRRMPIFFLKNQTNVYLPFVNIKILQALDRSEVKFIEKGIVNRILKHWNFALKEILIGEKNFGFKTLNQYKF